MALRPSRAARRKSWRSHGTGDGLTARSLPWNLFPGIVGVRERTATSLGAEGLDGAAHDMGRGYTTPLCTSSTRNDQILCSSANTVGSILLISRCNHMPLAFH